MINNELVATSKTRQAVDPSTGDYLPKVPVSTQEDVDQAVAAAQAAFPAWSQLTQDDRAEYLLKFVDAIETNQDGFAQLLGSEAGKPPGGVGMELFLLSRQMRETIKQRVTEETIQDAGDVCLHRSLLFLPSRSSPFPRSDQDGSLTGSFRRVCS